MTRSPFEQRFETCCAGQCAGQSIAVDLVQQLPLQELTQLVVTRRPEDIVVAAVFANALSRRGDRSVLEEEEEESAFVAHGAAGTSGNNLVRRKTKSSDSSRRGEKRIKNLNF